MLSPLDALVKLTYDCTVWLYEDQKLITLKEHRTHLVIGLILAAIAVYIVFAFIGMGFIVTFLCALALIVIELLALTALLMLMYYELKKLNLKRK